MLFRIGIAIFSSLALATTVAVGSAAAASLSRTSSFLYDSSGLLTKETIEPGSSTLSSSTTYEYDTFGNKTKATVGGSNISTGNERESTSSFSANGRFGTERKNPLLHAEQLEYNANFGGVTKLTGPNGLETNFTFDLFGRKTLEIRADGTRTQWEYLFCDGVNGGTEVGCGSDVKYVVKQTPKASDGATQIGPQVRVYKDALDREVRKETQGFAGQTIIEATQFNNLGQVSQKSRPYLQGGTPQWILFEYDELGRVKKETRPDGGKTEIVYNVLVTTITETVIGTSTTTQTVTKEKNSQGQLVKVTDAVGGITNYAYDPFGNLTTTTAPGTIVTSVQYDIRGRKTQMTDPDLGTWTYSYDAFGQLTQQTDAKSQVTTFQYDKLGRMTVRSEADLYSTWEYDTASVPKSKGKLVKAEAKPSMLGTAFYTRTHTYDPKGRPEETKITADGGIYSFTTFYDTSATANTGRVTGVQYPYPASSGLKTKYVYTSLGYLQEVRNDATDKPYWTATALNAEGQLTAFTHGFSDGGVNVAVNTAHTYFANSGRLDKIQATRSGDTANGIQNWAYTWDTAGILLTRYDAIPGRTETFTHDALNRLTNAAVSPGSTGVTKSATYNAIGNILTKSDVTSGTGVYAYGAAPDSSCPTGSVTAGKHAVSSITTGSLNGVANPNFCYDANGNLLKGANRQTVWTSYNAAQVIRNDADTVRLTFSHDSEHQRYKQVAQGGTTTTTLYLNDPTSGARVERINVGTTSIQWRNFIQAAGGIVAVHNQTEAGTPPAACTICYFHKDHLGSTSAITAENGQVITDGRTSYDAWGLRRNQSTGADTPNLDAPSDRGFTGHEHLHEVALIHMNGRVYDPQLGRFISADPFIQNPQNLQALNRYSYCNNNPLAYTDPSGYFNIGRFFRTFFRTFVTALFVGPILALPPVQEVIRSQPLLQAAVQIGFAATGNPFAAAAGSAYITSINGGSLGDIFKSAAITFATAEAFNAVGTATNGHGRSWDYYKEFDFIKNVAGHAAVGCAQTAALGGECSTGALTAAVGAFASPAISGLGPVGGRVAAAVVGGGTSVLGGGKFANGAVTSSFGYLFNGLGGRIVGAFVGSFVGLGVAPEGGFLSAYRGAVIGREVFDVLEDQLLGAPIEKHHSDPEFMGGAQDQQRTPMTRSEHQALHRDMYDFLYTQRDVVGNHMRPQRGNSTLDIQGNFSRAERIDALGQFYRGPGAKYQGSARDFFSQHPDQK